MSKLGANTHSLLDKLREFVLENVEVLGTSEEVILGTGSDGFELEVEINGELYTAKTIHEVLLGTDEWIKSLETIATKYLTESRLMSRIRHPNIVQFIGLYFPTELQLPLFVMERLECSLDDLIETTPTLPLSVSVYMLMGVCRGLLHLHSESIVHQNLTARNVLLTASLKAKITNFNIMQMGPGQLEKILMRFPRSLVYMPPEAVSEQGQHGPSLDVFSFGVLALFVLTQVFPGDLLPSTYSDPNSPDHLLPRSEFERRSEYTFLLERSLVGGREHRLFGVVRECLANNPKERPTISNLISILEEMGTETEGGLLQLDIERVKISRTIRAKDLRIQELQRELTKKMDLLVQKDCLLAERETLIARQQEDLTAMDDIIVRKNRELDGKNIQLAQIGQTLVQKNGLIADQQATIADLQATLAEREKALTEKEALIQAHKEQIDLKDANLASCAKRLEIDPSRELRLPLKLKWRRGKDMPIKMGGTIGSVVIGDIVYVGRGWADSDKDMCTVMKLDLQRDEWTKLPQYNARSFTMTSVDNQLVLVGGWNPSTHKPTNQIGVFTAGKWACTYPPMNIARHCSTAVCFKNHIVVAGGRDSQRRISSVEVLDIALRKWYIAEPLPYPQTEMKSTLIESTLYLMGGWDHTGSTKVVYKVDLNDLKINDSKQTTPTNWQTIQDTPLYHSTPLSIGNSLLAVGGYDDRRNPSSSIYLYQPDTRVWVKVGDLPTARYFCTCSVLSNGEIIVAGGETGQYISIVDFLNLS